MVPLTPELLSQIALMLFSGLIMEKHYVSRPSLLPNFLILGFIMLSNWNQIPQFLQIWVWIGFGLGFFSLIAYYRDWEFFDEIYLVTYPLYGLKTITGVYLGFLIFDAGDQVNTALMVGAVLVVVIWAIGIKIFKNDYPLSGNVSN